ncbi:MAG: hypothetical protein AB7U95_20455 [Reyranella sp.]
MATTPRDSKVQEKTEVLDGECLRALGHPNDHAIRQELLSALEGDDSIHPGHAGSWLRDRPEQVRDHFAVLSSVVHADTSNPDTEARSLCHGIQSLYRGLAARVQVLAACRGKRGHGPDQGKP